MRDLDTRELASDVYGNPRQARTWARSPRCVSAQVRRDAVNASYVILYTAKQRLTVSYLRQFCTNALLGV